MNNDFLQDICKPRQLIHSTGCIPLNKSQQSQFRINARYLFCGNTEVYKYCRFIQSDKERLKKFIFHGIFSIKQKYDRYMLRYIYEQYAGRYIIPHDSIKEMLDGTILRELPMDMIVLIINYI